MAYLWQAGVGHVSVLAASEDVSDVLARPDLPARLRKQLEFSQHIRDFSVSTLYLPDNQSYRRYADLTRPYAVWNVVATGADNLELKKTCFPITGCIAYLGFYAQADARAYAGRLAQDGMDVAVVGVPAYSTLGFSPDPLLNTFIYFPTGELARLIFHELAHQVLYVKDDTQFNESFATALEELGVERWLTQVHSPEIAKSYVQFDAKRKAFRALMARARQDLKNGYEAPDLSRDEKLSFKQARIAQLMDDYRDLKATWGGWSGFDAYMSTDVNNAKLAISGLYDDYVPAFKLLFKTCEGSFPRFYQAVRVLGDQGPEARALFGSGAPSFQVGCPS